MINTELALRQYIRSIINKSLNEANVFGAEPTSSADIPEVEDLFTDFDNIFFQIISI